MKWWSPRIRRIAGVIVMLICVQALAVVMYRMVKDRRDTASPSPFEVQTLNGNPLPAMDLVNANGARVRWEELGGKPVLVHFWATWCTPCRKEIPALLEVARARHGKLRVLAVSLDEDWAPVRLFFGGAIPEQVSRPLDPEAQRRYGVTTLPDTFVANSSGKLIARLAGARDWRSAQAHQLLHAWEEGTRR